MANWLKDYIGNYNIKYKLWLDSLQGYQNSKNIKFGTNGDGYAKFDGGLVYTSDKPKLRIEGDLEVICKFELDNWYGSLPHTLINKFGGGGNRGYNVFIGGSTPCLWYSDNGSDNHVIRSTEALQGVINGQPTWVKIEFDVDNGSGGNTTKFYQSNDGVNWTKLGTDVVRSGTTKIYPSTENLAIGARGGQETLLGKIYNVVIRDGIGGTIVSSADFGDAFPKQITTFLDSENNEYSKYGDVEYGFGSPNLTILNASHPGANIGYMADETRFNTISVMNPHLTFISLGHNQGSSLSIRTDYAALLDMVLEKHPYTGLVLIAQNPQVAPEPNIIPHAIRCGEIGTIASNNQYGFIDVFRTFMETGEPQEYMFDGAHPNQAGTKLWLNEVKKFVKGAVIK